MGPLKFAVASIGYNRPEMQDLQLEYLSNARGAKAIPVYMFIDAGGMSEEQAKELQSTHSDRFAYLGLYYHTKKQGLSRNILESIRRMFHVYDNVCIMEDDIIVSADFFEFFRYVLESFDLVEMKVFSVCAYSKRPIAYDRKVNPEEALHLRNWYNPDAVMITRSVWKKVEPLIEGYLRHREAMLDTLRTSCKINDPKFEAKQWASGKHNSLSQDGFLNTVRASMGMRSLHPERSRAQDIGYYGAHHSQKTNQGENVRDPKFWKKAPWRSSSFRMDAEWDRLQVVT